MSFRSLIEVGTSSTTCYCRIGSSAWKAEWGPNYHPSMFIGLASLAFSTVLAFGMSHSQVSDVYIVITSWYSVIRCILVRENARLEKDELADLKGAKRERIEEAARLEGLTFEEALERKKGFRYLY